MARLRLGAVETLQQVFRLVRPQGDERVISLLPPRHMDRTGVNGVGGEVADFDVLYGQLIERSDQAEGGGQRLRLGAGVGQDERDLPLRPLDASHFAGQDKAVFGEERGAISRPRWRRPASWPACPERRRRGVGPPSAGAEAVLELAVQAVDEAAGVALHHLAEAALVVGGAMGVHAVPAQINLRRRGQQLFGGFRACASTGKSKRTRANAARRIMGVLRGENGRRRWG